MVKEYHLDVSISNGALQQKNDIFFHWGFGFHYQEKIKSYKKRQSQSPSHTRNLQKLFELLYSNW